jgi:hypothetical protein
LEVKVAMKRKEKETYGSAWPGVSYRSDEMGIAVSKAIQ